MYWLVGPAACSSPRDSCLFPALLLQKRSKKVTWFESESLFKSRRVGKDPHIILRTHIEAQGRHHVIMIITATATTAIIIIIIIIITEALDKQLRIKLVIKIVNDGFDESLIIFKFVKTKSQNSCERTIRETKIFRNNSTFLRNVVGNSNAWFTKCSLSKKRNVSWTLNLIQSKQNYFVPNYHFLRFTL